VRPLPALLVVWSVAATAAACTPPSQTVGGRTRLAAATGGPDDGTRTPLSRHAKLKYEIRRRPFPLPLVTGTIAGQPALMLVDTGANSHVIAGWLARKLGLSMKKLGDVGTDHVGKSIATFRVEKPDLAIDEWGPLAASPVLATDVPEAIEKLGIGAFISPQRLVEEGDAVVLDLVKGELRAAIWDQAHDDLSATGVPLVLGDQGHACEENEGPIKGLSFVVPATIDSQRVDLLIDTGAQYSDIFSTSTAGQHLAGQSAVNKEPLYTASGKISARLLKGARVTAGAFSIVTDVDIIAGVGDAACPRDGVIAMDVLRSCALLLGRNRVYARCSPEPEPPPK